MPTKDEWAELKTHCVWTWTDNYNATGVSAYWGSAYQMQFVQAYAKPDWNQHTLLRFVCARVCVLQKQPTGVESVFWMLLSIHIWGMDLEICWIKNMVVVTNGSEVVLCVY